jgi:hypothetical protein
MQSAAVDWAEWTVHRVFFWESDNAKKGRILRELHHAVMYGLLALLIISHTVYRALWLQTFVLLCCALIWLQHVLTRGCLSSKVEQRLIGDESSFVDPFLDIVGIEANEASKQGIVILGSTAVTAILFLEWMSRVLSHLQGLVRAVVPVLHIPLPLSSPSGSLVPS